MGQPCQADWEACPADISETCSSSDVQPLVAPSGDCGHEGRPTRGAWGGQIKLLSKASGFGYIESQPIKDQYGCDVHFVVDLIQENGQFTVRSGDVVRFELSPTLQPGGKPQALSVSRANQIPYKKQRLPGESVTEMLTGLSEADDPLKTLKRPLTTGEVKIGKVKAYFPQNNYGFIACPEAKQKYGLDVYCPGQYLQDKHTGQVVSFEIALNKRGQPQAVDVKPVDEDQAWKLQKLSDAEWGY